jgi:hypothetical protein
MKSLQAPKFPSSKDSKKQSLFWQALGLMWKKIGKRWKLYNDLLYTAGASEFPDLSLPSNQD